MLKLETNVPQELLQEIAQKVVWELRPLLGKRSRDADDPYLTPDQLALYLGVTKQWVYERVHLGELPYIKVGRFLRFRKSVIDKWLESISVPASNPLSRSLKVISER